ncbi:hypothetical protein ACFRAQ_35725 [Nocardia sp. NPDC056611]|uniref:hypothetical protein n=1 Tax=Nocardia sp. NPDC056611 TaxID=3345877 RepID=UPI00366C2402
MDEELAWQRIQAEGPEHGDQYKIPPLSPRGYSLEVLLALKQIDLLKELMRVIPASFSGKLPPPFPPEPRPQTAYQRMRDRMDQIEVHNALSELGIYD